MVRQYFCASAQEDSSYLVLASSCLKRAAAEALLVLHHDLEHDLHSAQICVCVVLVSAAT